MTANITDYVRQLLATGVAGAKGSSMRPPTPIKPQDYITGMMGQEKAQDIVPFERLVPYQKYMGMANGVAEEKLNPEYSRYTQDYRRNYADQGVGGQQYMSGKYYSGLGQGLTDIERARQEDILSTTGQIKNVLDQQYQLLRDSYYQNPQIDYMGMMPSGFKNFKPRTEPLPYQFSSFNL